MSTEGTSAENEAQDSIETASESAMERPALPPPDFDFLVYSLRLQAELNLGLLPFGGNDENGPKADFELARHNIDLLGMLQEKTKGNLSLEEQRTLDNSVTELRFRFVQAQQSEKMSVKITVLGSGTSSGVPTIGCSCIVCTSSDPHDTRLRPSILIQQDGKNIVIDTTPDFRAQILRAKVDRLDAIIYTHAHADHIMGLDDIRPFNYHQRAAIPVYVAPAALSTIERVFAYVFDPQEAQSTVPKITVNLLDGKPFEAAGLCFEPIPLDHGRQIIYGYRFGNAAYLTDHSSIPEASLDRLHNLDVLFLDSLRHRPHPTHSTVSDALETVARLKPRRTFLTHICHDLGHAATQAALPEGVFMAYDGLVIDVDNAA